MKYFVLNLDRTINFLHNISDTDRTNFITSNINVDEYLNTETVHSNEG